MVNAEFQPAIVVSLTELNDHMLKAMTKFGSQIVWQDVDRRHAALAGKRIMVRAVDDKCKACGAQYCEVERESAIAVLPEWIVEGAAGAGICSSVVRTD